MQKRVAAVLRQSLYYLLAVSIVVLPLLPVAETRLLGGASVAFASNGSTTGGTHQPQASTGSPAPYSPPDEPYYLVSSYQIGRSTDFNLASPHWQNITPTDSNFAGTRIVDFMLDPFSPWTNALVTANAPSDPNQSGGVWVTTDLATTSPTWTQRLKFSQIAADYIKLGKPNPDAGCSVQSIGRLAANPERSGSYVLTVGSMTNGQALQTCPEIAYITADSGLTWQATLIHAATTACQNYECSFAPESGVGFGANNTIAMLEYHEATPSNYPFFARSSDGGASWQNDFKEQGQLFNTNSVGIYTSRYSANTSLMLTQTAANGGPIMTVWTTQNDWQDFSPTPLQVGSNTFSPDNNRNNLRGFKGTGGEHIYLSATQNGDTSGYSYLFDSLDMGSTWQEKGKLAAPYWTAYAVHPRRDTYRLSAVSDGYNYQPCTKPVPTSPTCLRIVAATTDGNTWTDRTGDWFTSTQFTHSWAGGNVIITAPSFAQIDLPPDPDQRAGGGAGPGWDAPNDWFSSPIDNTALPGGPGDVDPATGNYGYAVTDMTIGTRNGPLSFRRIYSGQHLTWKDNKLLGPGWTTSFQVRLIFPSSGGTNPSDPYGEARAGYVILQDGDGSRLKFTDQGDNGQGGHTYSPTAGVIATLTRSGSSPNYIYTVVLANSTVLTFNSAGQISTADRVLRDTTGALLPWNPLTFVYDTTTTPQRLLCVVDGADPNLSARQPNQAQSPHYFGFAYDSASGALLQVFDERAGPVANHCTTTASTVTTGGVRFSYQSTSPSTSSQCPIGYLCSAKRLTGDTKLDSTGDNTWTYQYAKNASTGPYPLNGVLDPSGSPVESETYYPGGRQVQTQIVNGLPTSYGYGQDTDGTLLSGVTTGTASKVTYKYDGLTHTFSGVRYNDPNGNQIETTIQPDQNYQPQQIDMPSSAGSGGRSVTKVTWSPDGSAPVSVTDPSSATWTYDRKPTSPSYNRLDGIHAPAPAGNSGTADTQINYDPTFSSLPSDVKGPTGVQTHFTFYTQVGLGYGYLKEVTAQGIKTDYTYDDQGQLSKIQVNVGGQTHPN